MFCVDYIKSKSETSHVEWSHFFEENHSSHSFLLIEIVHSACNLFMTDFFPHKKWKSNLQFSYCITISKLFIIFCVHIISICTTMHIYWIWCYVIMQFFDYTTEKIFVFVPLLKNLYWSIFLHIFNKTTCNFVLIFFMEGNVKICGIDKVNKSRMQT